MKGVVNIMPASKRGEGGRTEVVRSRQAVGAVKSAFSELQWTLVPQGCLSSPKVMFLELNEQRPWTSLSTELKAQWRPGSLHFISLRWVQHLWKHWFHDWSPMHPLQLEKGPPFCPRKESVQLFSSHVNPSVICSFCSSSEPFGGIFHEPPQTVPWVYHNEHAVEGDHCSLFSEEENFHLSFQPYCCFLFREEEWLTQMLKLEKGILPV